MARAARVARNIGWSVLAQLAVAAANLLLIPRLVDGFGESGYGLYVLMFTAASYVQMLSLGSGTAIVHFTGESLRQGRGTRLRDSLRQGAVLHVGGPALGAVALWAGAPWAARELLSLPPDALETGVVLLRAASVAAVLAAGAGWAQAALQGFQRFSLQSGPALLQGVLMPAGMAALLGLGAGLREAGPWYALVNAAAFALGAAALALVYRSGACPSGGEGLAPGEMRRYSVSLTLGPVAWIVAHQFDRVLIARSLELSALTLYAVPQGLLQRLQTLPQAVSSAMLPAFSGASGSREDARLMYVRATRLTAGAMAPLFLLLFILMPQFLSLWLGGRFDDEGVWPARLLTAAYGIASLSYVCHPVAASRGWTWWLSWYHSATAAACVLLWAVLVPRFGILGAAAGTLGANLIATAGYTHAINRGLGLTWENWLKAAEPAAIAGSALVACVFPLHHLAGSWTSLIAMGIAGAAVYALVFWLRLPALDRDFFRARLG